MLVYAEAGLLILLFRIACLGRARPPLSPAVRCLTGLWLGMAVWVAGGLLHAWVPIWKMLLIGLALGLIAAYAPPRLRALAQPLADLLAVAALGLLSVIPVSAVWIAAAAAAFAAGGYLLDGCTRLLPQRIQSPALLVMPLLLLALMGLNLQQPDDFDSRLWSRDPWFALRLAFAAPLPGKRVQFESGTVAWLLQNPRSRTGDVALYVHGNHPAGSWQPAAIALQGALLRAGYQVLSVDHPGYGASPHPDVNADWRAWDPLPGLNEARSYARSRIASPASRTIVVGHSMGVDTTLMWLKDDIGVQDVYLFAGAITRPPLSPLDDIKLFHQQRSMLCCIPGQTMQAITDHFYRSAEFYARELPANHPPVHFVRFGIEYADVAVDREPLYAAISAPKSVCDFPGATHYMNTLSLRRFILLDTDATLRGARIFAPGAVPGC